jgi:hypothetical protein
LLITPLIILWPPLIFVASSIGLYALFLATLAVKAVNTFSWPRALLASAAGLALTTPFAACSVLFLVLFLVPIIAPLAANVVSLMFPALIPPAP